MIHIPSKSLSTVVLNSRDRHEKTWQPTFAYLHNMLHNMIAITLCCKSLLLQVFMKLAKFQWITLFLQQTHRYSTKSMIFEQFLMQNFSNDKYCLCKVKKSITISPIIAISIKKQYIAHH